MVWGCHVDGRVPLLGPRPPAAACPDRARLRGRAGTLRFGPSPRRWAMVALILVVAALGLLGLFLATGIFVLLMAAALMAAVLAAVLCRPLRNAMLVGVSLLTCLTAAEAFLMAQAPR